MSVLSLARPELLSLKPYSSARMPQRENGDALRYASAGLVIASVTFVTIAVVELLLE